MDTISTDELRSLAAIQSPTAVTLCLPTHLAGEAALQDAIRLKNLMRQAEDQLEALGTRRCEATKLLARGGELPDNKEFWTRRSEGLVIYLSPNFFRTYRLPIAVNESCTVGRRLESKPLLSVADRGERYLLLVLSQNHLQLFEATPSGIGKVTVKGLPENKRRALNYDGVDRGEQVHMGMKGGPGKRAAVFHGQGGGKDTAKVDVEQFYRIAGRALEPLLRNESAPLLLAGVDYLLPIFRQTCSYPHLLERHLAGNAHLLTNQQLHEQSWEIMRPFFDRPRREALDRLRAQLGTGKASVDSADVATAATTGKVDVLLADMGQVEVGTFDSRLGRAFVGSEPVVNREDLVNLAVAETLLHGGAVYSVAAHELPDEAAVGAIYRY